MARKCPLCGSRKWRKDGVTGSVVCEDGHVLQGVVSETHVAGEPTGHALQRRRLTRGPRVNKRRTVGRANANFLHGEEAEYLRLQGLQLMLRYQVQALRRLWGLPDIYEVIVRDLWAYQLLITPPLSTEGKKAKKQAAEAEANPPPDGTQVVSGSETEQQDEESDDDDSEKSHWEETSSSSDKDDSLTDDEELLRSTPREENDLPRSRGENTALSTDAWKRNRPLHASDVLVCLIMGLWFTRTPFTYKDIESLVNTNQIPYIDFGKTTLLPENMRAAMNVSVRVSLRPQRSPAPYTLWRYSRDFARVLQLRFGQVIPESNVPPMAWCVLSQLGGNAVTQDQVLAFLNLIDTNMGIVHTSVGTYIRKRRNSDSQQTVQQTKRYRDLEMPELSVAAAWVIVMKMSYGLDGRERLPLVATDPLIGMPKGDLWLLDLEKRLRSGVLKGPSEELERQFFDTMDGDDIDRFLDKCEDVLLKDREHGTGNNAFPLPSVPRTAPPLPAPNSWAAFHTAAARDPVAQASPVPSTTKNADLPLMPGEALQSFAVTEISALPQQLQVVLKAAADVVGVTPLQVATVVELFERRMEGVRPRRSYSTKLRAARLRGTMMRESVSCSSLSPGP